MQIQVCHSLQEYINSATEGLRLLRNILACHKLELALLASSTDLGHLLFLLKRTCTGTPACCFLRLHKEGGKRRRRVEGQARGSYIQQTLEVPEDPLSRSRVLHQLQEED